jgi:putative redox protein
MTVRAFADRHSWPLDHVEVAVRFDAQGQIVKNVQLTGDLEPDHIRQLLAVAGRCPVQRLLSREVSIVTVPTVLTRPRVSRSRTLPE